MTFKLQKTNNTTYLECDPTEVIIRNEQDVLDLVAVCGEHGSHKLMLYEANFSPDFFDLKTNLAGTLFQKFANYHLKGAGIISFDNIKSDRFKELIFEYNRGNLFRFFEDKEAAEKWLARE